MVYLSNQSINLASRPLDPFACERLQGIQQSVNAVQHVVPCVVLNNTAVTTHTHVRQTVERFRYYATATQYKRICFVNAERENMPNARYAHEPLAGAAATRMRNRGATRSSDIRKQRKTSMSSRARRAYRQVLLGSSRSYRQFVTRLIFSTIDSARRQPLHTHKAGRGGPSVKAAALIATSAAVPTGGVP